MPSNIDKDDKLEILANIMDLFIGNLMDLSLVITIVKRKNLKVLSIKKIYNDYNLYYYCKQSHLDMIPKTHPNKDIALQFGQFIDIEDD